MPISITFSGEDPRVVVADVSAFLSALTPAAARSAAPAAPLAGDPQPEAEAPKRRGRPPKAAEQAPEPPEAPQEATANAPEPTPAPQPAAAPAAPAEAEAIDRPMLQKVLIEVVKRFGKDKCGELCRAHGGPNLSALAEDVYPALLADARKVLASGE